MNKIKKSFTGCLGDFFFFAMQVIGKEQFFKVGLGWNIWPLYFIRTILFWRKCRLGNYPEILNNLILSHLNDYFHNQFENGMLRCLWWMKDGAPAQKLDIIPWRWVASTITRPYPMWFLFVGLFEIMSICYAPTMCQ